MKVETLADGSLEIRESFRFLRIASVFCSGAAVLVSAFVLASGSGEAGKVGWAALGVAMLCLAGMVVDDRRFLFDATKKTLTWDLNNLFRARRGQMPFSDIRDVVVAGERSRDNDHTVGGYTIRHSAALVTTAGTLRLSSSHGRDAREYRQLAEKVLAVLAVPEKTAQADEAQRLIAAGRMIDAVGLIRQRDGRSLNAAQSAAHSTRQKRDPS